MKIKIAKIVHVPQMVEVWKEFMDYHGSLDAHFKRREDAHINFEKYIKSLIVFKDSRVVAAIEGGEVVGFAIGVIVGYPPVFKRELHGFIDTMAVKSDYRRSGIGEKMLKNLLAWFKKRGLDRIELRVAARNPIGYAFWKKSGFKDYLHVLYLERKPPH